MWGSVLYLVEHHGVNRGYILFHVSESPRKGAAAPIAGLGMWGIEPVCLVGLRPFHDVLRSLLDVTLHCGVSLYLVQVVMIGEVES